MKAEFERVYGPPGRREFVEGLPCIVNSVICTAPSHNHHTKNGGMGRKADFDAIVPLCFDHHQEIHTTGAETFAQRYWLNLRESARLTESLWQDHTNGELSE